MEESGYGGERVVLMAPSDYPLIQALCQVTRDLLQTVGIEVEYASMDWGTLVQRRASREPPDKGGWNAFCTTYEGLSVATPASHFPLRGNGRNGWFGWPTSPRIEALRDAWFDAPDLAAQRQICEQIRAAGVGGGALYPARPVVQPDGDAQRPGGCGEGAVSHLLGRAAGVMRAVLLALALLAAGCTVGPDFAAPQPWWNPASWGRQDAPAAAAVPSRPSAEPVDAQWWRLFDDPLLTGLEERLAAADLDVRLASLRLAEARFSLGATAAAAYPQVNGNASYTGQQLSKSGVLSLAQGSSAAREANGLSSGSAGVPNTGSWGFSIRSTCSSTASMRPGNSIYGGGCAAMWNPLRPM